MGSNASNPRQPQPRRPWRVEVGPMFHQFLKESRLTLALALPIMAGQVSQMLMAVLDSAMVGRVGVTSLAASAFAGNLLSIPVVFGMGLLTCISVRAAEAHGAGQNRESGEVLRHGLAIAGGVGAILTLLIYVLSFYLDRFGQDAEVAALARPFALLIGASLVPALLALGLKQWCEAIGNPWPPTLLLLGAVPLNAALNWVLIYGNLGFAAQGLNGAGWATLISRIVSLGAIVIWVMRSPKTRRYLPTRGLKSLEMARTISLLRIGVPASLQIIVEVGAFATGAILVGRIGASELAAHQIALSCASTTFMLPLGLSIATSIRIGQAVGQGEFKGVKSIGNASLLLSLGLMTLTATSFLLFRHPIASAFVREPAVAELAAQLLMIVALFQLFDGLQVVAAGALRGLSDATWPMILAFVAYWVVGLPLGYVLAFPLGWGAQGIWSGLAVALGCAALALVWRFGLKSRVEAGAEVAVEVEKREEVMAT